MEGAATAATTLEEAHTADAIAAGKQQVEKAAVKKGNEQRTGRQTCGKLVARGMGCEAACKRWRRSKL